MQKNEAKAIFDGRISNVDGPSTIAPPIELFHPIFERFMRRIENPSLEPTAEEIAQVCKLASAVSVIHPAEAGRFVRCRNQLASILGTVIHPEPNLDGTSADGVVALDVVDTRIKYLIYELKRELGEGGCDVTIQAGLSMKRSWTESHVSSIWINIQLI